MGPTPARDRGPGWPIIAADSACWLCRPRWPLVLVGAARVPSLVANTAWPSVVSHCMASAAGSPGWTRSPGGGSVSTMWSDSEAGTGCRGTHCTRRHLEFPRLLFVRLRFYKLMCQMDVNDGCFGSTDKSRERSRAPCPPALVLHAERKSPAGDGEDKVGGCEMHNSHPGALGAHTPFPPFPT